MRQSNLKYSILKIIGLLLVYLIVLPTYLSAIEAGPSILNPVLPHLEIHSNIGSTRMSIPIEVPPGRLGVEPGLKLVYNSFYRNSWLGVGWNLNLGAIQRSTKRGVNYGNDNFVVLNNDAISELVDRREIWGDNYYGCKVESAFSKYYYYASIDRWVVTKRDGTKLYYGSSPESRISNYAGTFKWLLDRVEDTNGNYMSISYITDQGQLYPYRIIYTGNSYTGTPGSKSVYFDLENRADVSINYQSNYEVKTAKRLSSIRVNSINGDTIEHIRTYNLIYEYEASAGFSRLISIELAAPDDSPALPPVSIDWHNAGTGDFGHSIRHSILPPTIREKRGKAFIADINGDSKTDLVVTSFRHWAIGSPTYEVFFSLSNGDGTFSPARIFPIRQRGQLINFADVNGDGLSDIIFYYCYGSVEDYHAYLSNGDGTFHGPIFTRFSSSVPENSKVYFGDINGDGYSDIIFHWGSFLYQRLSNGDGTFKKNNRLFINSPPNIIGFVDVNGDGLADCLGYRNQYAYRFFYVNFSKGDGTFGPQIRSPIPGKMHEDAIPSLGDINGDGLVDVVFAYNSSTYIKISEGDGTYRAGREFQGLIASEGLHLSDINGDGADDLFQVILSTDESVSVYTNFCKNSGNPFLVTGFTSRTGAKSTYSYSHSNLFMNTFLPFVVPTLASVSVDDGLGNISKSQYEYSEGYFDSIHRSFRGFGQVKLINPDNSITETYFCQGEYDNGRAYRIDLKEPEGSENILTTTSFFWDHAEMHNGAFVKLARKRTEYFDSETAYEQENYSYDRNTGLLIQKITEGTNGPLIKHQYVYQNLNQWLWRKSEESILNQNDQLIRQTLYEHQSKTGNIKSIEYFLDNGENPIERFEYDPYGNTTHFYDANGNPPETTIYDPTTHTFPISVTNPLGHSTNYTWNYKFGRKSSETDPNSNTTLFYYDAIGRLIRTEYPDGGEQLILYNDCVDSQCSRALIPNRILSKTMEMGSPAVYIEKYEYFDAFGRNVQTITLGEGNKTIISRNYYDRMGRIRRSEGPFFSSLIGYPIDAPEGIPYTDTFYDYRSRPTRMEIPLGEATEQDDFAVTNFHYYGFSTTTTDPDHCKRTEKRDYLSRIVQVSEHLDENTINTNYGYNAAGDLLSVTNHGNITTTIEYDTLGRKISMDDPDMGGWQYRYDANGNLISQKDANLQTIEFTYDALNRPTQKTLSTPGSDVTYYYDEASIQNGIGRLYRIENDYAWTTYKAFDAMGRQLLIEKSIEGAPLPNYLLSYSYDLSGKVISLVYPDSYQLNYTYHPGSGLLDSVTGITDFVEYANIEDYQPSGKIGYIYHGNGTATTYSYDSKSARLLSIKTQDSGLNCILDKAYKYSHAGDIVEIADSSGLMPVIYNYTYDKLHRLLLENNSGGVDSFQDAEITKLYDDTAPFHAPKKIVSRGTEYLLDYDANGNLRSGYDFSDPSNVVKRTISYNPDNMPTKITYTNAESSVSVDLYYNGENKRVKKTVQGGSTDLYISENFEIIDGVETKYIFAGNLRIAKVTPSETIYYHKDHLGSSSAVTDGQTGTLVERTQYLPFGMTRNHSGPNTSNYKFTDQEHDSEIGLYNYDARLYDPVGGIFITADSIVPGEGLNPQYLNRYSYVGNNPLKYIDPTGHWFRSPDTGENVASDPSNYDIDYGGNYGQPGSFSGTHVDANDGDDPGEAGWEYSDSNSYWVDHRGDSAKLAGKIVAEVSFSFTPLTFVTKARLLSKLKWLSKLKPLCRTPKKPVVIGENMKRVQQYADEIGYRAFRPWNNHPFNYALGVKHTKRWINVIKKEGREIVDIGPDFRRRSLGRHPSDFYNIERSLLKGYDNYTKAFERTGKKSGGVPGLDF